ncbi:MAG: crotonase/enoyl-CoA hydratase family protein [Deltaproteobacteria bacterium]|nr:crotonase/enoyl-CoA hydratase family protein [Deltaproteobacteria bacterium]
MTDMSYETLLYETRGRIATITLNRPEKLNAIRPPMPEELERAVAAANADRAIRVIVLRGAGEGFCAGFDFSGGLEHFAGWGGQAAAEAWDPGNDLVLSTSPFVAPVPKFMSLWRSPKPVIAQIHGWCVGGASDMALCADVVIAAEDAQIGTPYSRVWGCYLTGMWIYRLGLTRAKLHALTGEPLSGRQAADLGLINFAYPAERLEAEVRAFAERLARIPLSQLHAMKLVVNQAYENMGLAATQLLGPILDGYMRNTPDGRAFVETARARGVGAAVRERDAPFGDYSQGPASRRPRRKKR